MSDLSNKVLMYSVCEMCLGESGSFIECQPIPLCLTNDREKLFNFIDEYILDFIDFINEEDEADEEYTKISIEVDQQWWKNLNDKTWPIGPNNYPSNVIIEHTMTGIDCTTYTILYISESYIEFV